MWLDRSSVGTLLAVLSVATLVESGYPNTKNGDLFQCQEEGFHADPYDPMVFYRCVDFGNGSPLVKYRFTCGPGTVFSKADGDVCVHAPSCGQKGCGGTNDGSDKINDIDTDNKPGTGKEKPGVQGKPESRPPSSSSSPPPSPSSTCPHCPSKVPGSAGTTVAVTPSSVTASQTTAQVPTKTPVIGTQCKCAGFMADPNNCYKFYQCVDDGNGSFRRYEFTCGPGTIWDPKIDTCNHPWAANRAGCPGATATNPPKPAPPSGSSHETTTGATTSSPSGGASPSSPNAGATTSSPNAGATTSSPSAGASPSSPSAGASPSSPSTGATPSSPNAGAPPSSPSAGATQSSVGPPEETASTVESVTSSESHTHPSSQPGNGPPCTCEGFMENPKDCTKYYRCVNDETGTYERYEFACADGAFWDQNSGTCIYPPDGKLPAGCKASTGSTSPSSPASQPEETTVTEPTKPSTGGPQCTVDGFMEDPEDCTKFYRCVENGMGSYTRYEFTCAAGTVWDPIAVTCNHPWAANRAGCKDPTDSTPQSSPASEPEEPTQTPNPSAGGPQCTCEGFMEDPQDCRKFYRCVSVGTNSYQRYEFECGPDTVWDQNVLTCNHPWQANRPECADTPTPRPSHGTPKPSEPTVTAGSPGTEPTQAPPGHGSSVAPPSGGSSAVPPSGGSSGAPPSGESSAAPPSGESSPAPPSSGSSAAPPSGESSAAPTSEESSGAPPSGGASSPPPSGESSTIPPCDGSTHVPPSDSSSAAPPSGSSSVAPPSGGSSGAPPSDGSPAVPPSDGSSGVPPSNGSSAVPPSDGSSGVPPSNGSGAPPSGSSSGAPPSSSSSAAPPSGSSSGAPPSGSSSVAPPSSGSSTVTPCDGSNEVGGDLGSGKEPACGEQPNEHCSVCKEEGFFPNEEDCTKFYRCVSTGHGTYWKYEFSCGPGTAWDQSLLTCNHRSQVASCKSGGSTGVSSTEKPAKITTASSSSSESTSSSSSSSSESTTESSSESGTSAEPCDGATGGTTDHSVTEPKEPVTETSANSTPDFGSTASTEVTTGESTATSTDASQATTVTEEQSTVTDSASTEVENVPTSTDHPDESQSTTSQGEEGTTNDSGEPSTSGSHETTTEVDQSSTETSAPSTSTEGCSSAGGTTPSSTPCNEPPPSATVPCPIGNLTGDQIVLVCPTGFKRHPKYCNIFYQCTSDSPMEVKIVTFGCPDDTIFDEKKVQCLPENEGSQPCDGMKAGARVYRRVDRSPMSMVYVEQREPLCPAEGYHPYNKEKCSSFFYKCKNDSSEELRGYMYECPEGFVFSQVSRRCERPSSLPACTDEYDFGENNASPTRSKLQLPMEISNVSPRKLANY